MAYSTSEKTVRARLPLLKPLLSGKPCAWRVKPEEQTLLIYQIREALFVARTYHPRKFPELAEIAKKFSIIRDGATRIVAVEKKVKGTSALELEVSAAEPEVAQLPFDMEAPAPERTREVKPAFEIPEVSIFETEAAVEVKRVTIEGQQSHFTIIEYWRQSEASLIYFPSAGLDDRALGKLYRWAKAQDPELMFLEEDGALTLSTIDPDVEEFQWSPSHADAQ